MRYPLAAIAAPLAASLCLVSAAFPASAQVTNCWMGTSPGPPAVNDQHFLCGEVRMRPNGTQFAAGFHSRHNGVNPTSPGAAGPIQIISNDNNITRVQGLTDIYKIRNFDITQGGTTRTKNLSTMFPDHCSPTAVLAAIRNAAGGGVLGARVQFIGMSGTGCLANGQQFNIIGHTDAAGVIDSAWPNY